VKRLFRLVTKHAFERQTDGRTESDSNSVLLTELDARWKPSQYAHSIYIFLRNAFSIPTAWSGSGSLRSRVTVSRGSMRRWLLIVTGYCTRTLKYRCLDAVGRDGRRLTSCWE